MSMTQTGNYKTLVQQRYPPNRIRVSRNANCASNFRTLKQK